jgi:Ni,Fe-hydrogenase maturation factor
MQPSSQTSATKDATEEVGSKTLIAGVGHRFWQDYSAGPTWIDQMNSIEWGREVDVEDYSFGAFAMTQNLQDQRYERAIFLSAESRGRAPGTLHLYRYEPGTETPDRVQQYMTEAGGGVVAIDPLLSIAGYFQALPRETWVLELEPLATGWGDPPSDAINALFPDVLAHIRNILAGCRTAADVEVRRDA